MRTTRMVLIALNRIIRHILGSRVVDGMLKTPSDISFFFFKLYFIDYAITVILIFSPLAPLPPAPPTSSGNPPHHSLFTFMGHACKFFGYSISYTVLYIHMAGLFLF